MSYIDIHTHNPCTDFEGISISNLFPDEKVPDADPLRFYSVGLHPWLLEGNANVDELMGFVEQKASLPQVIAVGECGFDRMASAGLEIQGRVFAWHIRIAEDIEKPVFIHCVKSYNELIYFRKRLRPRTPWILHGFSGTSDLAMQLHKLGFFFSFGKALLNPRSKAIQAFQRLPAESVFLETDECELGIPDLYLHASALKSCQVEDIDNQIQLNFNRVFRKT